MNNKELRSLWLSDLYRYSGDSTLKSFVKCILFVPGFRYSFFMRLCSTLNTRKSSFFVILCIIFRVFLVHYEVKYGISIPYNTKIGKGFYIGHFGTIVINPKAVIGNNCNISQGVTIGVSNRGEKKGCPSIGNNVFIGPGAKIFGSIKIGNNVAIGANCVVTKDVPDYAVVVGAPGKVISYKGSMSYVNHTDYSM